MAKLYSIYLYTVSYSIAGCTIHLRPNDEKVNIFELTAVSFMTDYECGMRKALAEMYPAANLNSCWFHYCQAIRRKCSKFVGFFEKVQSKNSAEKLFLKFLALPLLPANKIKEAFNMLKLSAEAMDDNGKLFKPLLKYYEAQWLQRILSSFHTY